jgi:prefoldin subunit 5
MMPDQNYNQLVLAQLQALSQGIEALRVDLQTVKQELTKLKAREDRVDDLQEWKTRVNEVVSPSQLAQLVADVRELSDFKTKAVTIFAVVQFGMAVLVLVSKLMGPIT